MPRRLQYQWFKHLKADEEISPKSDEELRILAGRVSHVTGTQSLLTVYKGTVPTIHIISRFIVLPAVVGSCNYALNPIRCHDHLQEELITDSKDLPIRAPLKVRLSGDTDVTADLLIEVTKIDPKTGRRLA